MLMWFVNNVLIDLVSDDVGVIFDRKRCYYLEFFFCEHLSGRVGRVAEYHGLRMLSEGVLEHFGIEVEVRRAQRHVNWFRSGQYGVCAVVLIEWREYDYLVARVRNSEHG